MAVDELLVEALRVRDDAMPRRDLTVEYFKVATFYLGVHGPFTERLPADDTWSGELTRRIERLRATIRGLPT